MKGFDDFKSFSSYGLKTKLTKKQKIAICSGIAAVVILVIVLCAKGCGAASNNKVRANTFSVVRMYLEKGQYDRAMDKLDELLLKNPLDEEALALMDEILAKSQNVSRYIFFSGDWEVLEEMQKRGIPTVVWLTPVLPFINDTEENITAILNECVRVGVKGIICFDMGVTLREGDREYFYAALDKHFPYLKQKYIATYGNSYVVSSPNSKQLMQIFKKTCKDNGIIYDPDKCFEYMQEFPENKNQISIFDL